MEKKLLNNKFVLITHNDKSNFVYRKFYYGKSAAKIRRLY